MIKKLIEDFKLSKETKYQGTNWRTKLLGMKIWPKLR